MLPPEELTIVVEVIGNIGTAIVDKESLATEENVGATAPDGSISLFITEGTVAVNNNGKRLERVIVNQVTKTLSLVEDTFVIGPIVRLDPLGAKFSKSPMLSFTYDPANIPPEVSNEDLFIATWAGSEWVRIDTIVDTDNNTLTAEVEAMAVYTIMGEEAYLPPPEPVIEPEPMPEPEPSPVPAPTPTSTINWWLIIGLLAAVVISLIIIFYNRKRKIVFISPPQTIKAGEVSNIITIQIQNTFGKSFQVWDDTTIKLISTSPIGRFDISPKGAFDGSVTTVIILKGSTSVSLYYRDESAGPITITAIENPGQSGRKLTSSQARYLLY